mgnify:CR=1 FL=1
MRLTADKAVTWNDSAAPDGLSPGKEHVGPDPFGLVGFQIAVARAASVPSRQVPASVPSSSFTDAVYEAAIDRWTGS